MIAKKCEQLSSACYATFESPKKSVLKRMLKSLGYHEDLDGRNIFPDEESFSFFNQKGGFARLFRYRVGCWALHVRRK